jgi:hypothetical protein
MKFQRGVPNPYPRRPRGPGRGDSPYQMSRAAYHARISNLGRWLRPRTYAETRRIELEIALASHGHESCRQIARRFGLRSHAYCCRVIHRYRTGQIPSLPPDEDSLLAMRDSLGLRDTLADTALAEPARANIRGREDESAFVPQTFQPSVQHEQGFTTATDTEREAQKMIREAHRQNPGLQPMTWKEHVARARRSKRHGGWFHW